MSKKVYGGMFMYKGKQVRGIICGTQKDASVASEESLSRIGSHWCVTGNEKEISIATSKPKTLFYSPNNDHNYVEFKRR